MAIGQSQPRIVDRDFERADQAAARAVAKLTTYFEDGPPSFALLVKAHEDLSEALRCWRERDERRRG